MVFVLPVSKQQSKSAAQVLAKAFANDPFVSSLVPNDRSQARLQALFNHLIKRKYLNKECIDIAFDRPTKQVVEWHCGSNRKPRRRNGGSNFCILDTI